MTDAAAVDDETMLFTDFHQGFLGSSSAKYLPTDLLGQIQIRITLADAEVLSNRGAAGIGSGLAAEEADLILATPLTYSVSSIYFTVDTVAFSPVYGEMLRSRI
eukprot:3479858-Pleurochrysis_carterae.AAC.1